MIDEYIDANTKIKFRCIYGREFYKTPSQMIRSNPLCTKCADNTRKTTNQFIKEMENINPQIIIIGEYVNAETPIEKYKPTAIPLALDGG